MITSKLLLLLLEKCLLSVSDIIVAVFFSCVSTLTILWHSYPLVTMLNQKLTVVVLPGGLIGNRLHDIPMLWQSCRPPRHRS